MGVWSICQHIYIFGILSVCQIHPKTLRRHQRNSSNLSKVLRLLILLCSHQGMPTGDIEVVAENVEVFNVSRKLPFEMKDFVKVSV